MRLGSQRQLARELGCSPNHINELCKKNDYRIVKVGKKINLDESIEKLVEAGYGSKTKKKLAPKKAAPKTTKPKKEKLPEDPGGPESEEEKKTEPPVLDETAERQELERVKIYEQARKFRIENDAKEKKLIDRKDTENKWFEIARTVRDSLETIPGNVSGILVGKTKHEIEQELIKHIKRTLFNLKKVIK